MPELPEAEMFRRYLDSSVVGRRISGAEVVNKLILGNVSAERLKRTLRNALITGTRRHGKYVGIELQSKGLLILHFGMTGSVRLHKEGEMAPDHVTLGLDLDDGWHLSFACVRVLCRIFLAETMDSFAECKGLGPDALEGLTWEGFERLLSTRTGRIKSLLLDQHFIAGIGNIYADEILFQAGLHPLRNADSLSPEERYQLYFNIERVLREAVAADTDWSLMPVGYLIPNRGKGGRCPSCGVGLCELRIGGRSSHFCPRCQS